MNRQVEVGVILVRLGGVVADALFRIVAVNFDPLLFEDRNHDVGDFVHPLLFGTIFAETDVANLVGGAQIEGKSVLLELRKLRFRGVLRVGAESERQREKERERKRGKEFAFHNGDLYRMTR